MRASALQWRPLHGVHCVFRIPPDSVVKLGGVETPATLTLNPTPHAIDLFRMSALPSFFMWLAEIKVSVIEIVSQFTDCTQGVHVPTNWVLEMWLK